MAEITKEEANCPACGAARTPGKRFCGSCGVPLRMSS
jgi:predicted amidophosphoribosyltransferase